MGKNIFHFFRHLKKELYISSHFPRCSSHNVQTVRNNDNDDDNSERYILKNCTYIIKKL